ncbi:hypothetical protein [Mesonia aquimarina]|uniref:hypothetical protein n=1 Tax=Mesonia aquimarina TaxID=1504967 RepID=UPI000EF5A27B|nr:hypothetical protein [Mesonia aquimarina]
MKYKFHLLISFFIILASCGTDEREMIKTEKVLAEKYNAESFKLNFVTVNKTAYGQTTEDRKLLSIALKNTNDIEKIFKNNTYSNARAQSIATYIIDSLRFESLPFQPRILEINFISEVGFSLLKDEAKKTYTFTLDK